ncbi:MASE1 domain-containing protein [Stenotrophomonas sp. PS02289]|uniref:MASE1 domain-containing protein n=1 Tax=Stenotrophomonas sp. PS02289 TaxID=2991422 RepID=UPI00249B9B5B|nr:MASE1 domain-containing protein [Stenotrophomonas sp. PS02289]
MPTDLLTQWWIKATRLNIRIGLDGVLLALAYATCYGLSRNVSVDQFYLTAGVRLSALLLCPPRLWPYLFAGEFAYLFQLREPMMGTYGTLWVLLSAVTVLPAVAVLTRVHARAIRLGSTTWILTLAGSAAVTATLINVTLSEQLWPVPPEVSWPVRAARYALGDLIGMLTLAPLAVLWIQRRKGAATSFQPRIPALLLAATLVGMGVLASHLPADSTSASSTLRVLMVVPAVALTCMHGWHGAAFAVPLLNVTLGVTLDASGEPWSFDAPGYSVQLMLAVAGCALLAFGSSISHHFNRFSARDATSREVIDLARSSHAASEDNLRQTAVGINRVGEGIDVHLSETADWLIRQGHPRVAENLISTSAFYSRKFRAQASLVYPTALEHIGLYLALQVGGINDLWESTERLAQPRLIGDACRLSVPLQLAAYRTLTDAVSILLQNEKGQIRVNARCGKIGCVSGIVVIVEIMDRAHLLTEETVQASSSRLAGRLLAHAGEVQCRRNRIRMVLMDS